MILSVALCATHRYRVRHDREIRFHPLVNTVIGPNGSGKSTLLRAMRHCPHCVIERDRETRTVLYSSRQADPLSARFQRRGLAEAVLQTRALFSSHGEIMRDALALVAFGPGDTLLLDEPDAGQDVAWVERLRATLSDFAKEMGVQIIIATHHPLLWHEASLIERAEQLWQLLAGLLNFAWIAVVLTLAYFYLNYVLTLFPWTRGLGKRLLAIAIDPLQTMGLGLIDIVPNLVWAYFVLIMRTFFEALPPALEESAVVDGASEPVVFFRIIFPLSMPVIATVALFNAVWHWNTWFDTILLTRSKDLETLMSLLAKMLLEQQTNLISDLRNQRRVRYMTPTVLRAAMTIITVINVELA